MNVFYNSTAINQDAQLEKNASNKAHNRSFINFFPESGHHDIPVYIYESIIFPTLNISSDPPHAPLRYSTYYLNTPIYFTTNFFLYQEPGGVIFQELPRKTSPGQAIQPFAASDPDPAGLPPADGLQQDPKTRAELILLAAGGKKEQTKQIPIPENGLLQLLLKQETGSTDKLTQNI